MKSSNTDNGIRVTFTLPTLAAARLKEMVDGGNPGLRELGVVSVQINKGASKNKVGSLGSSNNYSRSSELALYTSNSDLDMLSLSCHPLPSPDDLENTRQNIRSYLSRPTDCASNSRALSNISSAEGTVLSSPSHIPEPRSVATHTSLFQQNPKIRHGRPIDCTRPYFAETDPVSRKRNSEAEYWKSACGSYWNWQQNHRLAYGEIATDGYSSHTGIARPMSPMYARSPPYAFNACSPRLRAGYPGQPPSYFPEPFGHIENERAWQHSNNSSTSPYLINLLHNNSSQMVKNLQASGPFETVLSMPSAPAKRKFQRNRKDVAVAQQISQAIDSLCMAGTDTFGNKPTTLSFGLDQSSFAFTMTRDMCRFDKPLQDQQVYANSQSENVVRLQGNMFSTTSLIVSTPNRFLPSAESIKSSSACILSTSNYAMAPPGAESGSARVAGASTYTLSTVAHITPTSENAVSASMSGASISNIVWSSGGATSATPTHVTSAHALSPSAHVSPLSVPANIIPVSCAFLSSGLPTSSLTSTSVPLVSTSHVILTSAHLLPKPAQDPCAQPSDLKSGQVPLHHLTSVTSCTVSPVDSARMSLQAVTTPVHGVSVSATVSLARHSISSTTYANSAHPVLTTSTCVSSSPAHISQPLLLKEHFNLNFIRSGENERNQITDDKSPKVTKTSDATSHSEQFCNDRLLELPTVWPPSNETVSTSLCDLSVPLSQTSHDLSLSLSSTITVQCKQEQQNPSSCSSTRSESWFREMPLPTAYGVNSIYSAANCTTVSSETVSRLPEVDARIKGSAKVSSQMPNPPYMEEQVMKNNLPANLSDLKDRMPENSENHPSVSVQMIQLSASLSDACYSMVKELQSVSTDRKTGTEENRQNSSFILSGAEFQHSSLLSLQDKVCSRHTCYGAMHCAVDSAKDVGGAKIVNAEHDHCRAPFDSGNTYADCKKTDISSKNLVAESLLDGVEKRKESCVKQADITHAVVDFQTLAAQCTKTAVDSTLAEKHDVSAEFGSPGSVTAVAKNDALGEDLKIISSNTVATSYVETTCFSNMSQNLSNMGITTIGSRKDDANVLTLDRTLVKFSNSTKAETLALAFDIEKTNDKILSCTGDSCDRKFLSSECMHDQDMLDNVNSQMVDVNAELVSISDANNDNQMEVVKNEKSVVNIGRLPTVSSTETVVNLRTDFLPVKEMLPKYGQSLETLCSDKEKDFSGAVDLPSITKLPELQRLEIHVSQSLRTRFADAQRCEDEDSAVQRPVVDSMQMCSCAAELLPGDEPARSDEEPKNNTVNQSNTAACILNFNDNQSHTDKADGLICSRAAVSSSLDLETGSTSLASLSSSTSTVNFCNETFADVSHLTLTQRDKTVFSDTIFKTTQENFTNRINSHRQLNIVNWSSAVDKNYLIANPKHSDSSFRSNGILVDSPSIFDLDVQEHCLMTKSSRSVSAVARPYVAEGNSSLSSKNCPVEVVSTCVIAGKDVPLSSGFPQLLPSSRVTYTISDGLCNHERSGRVDSSVVLDEAALAMHSEVLCSKLETVSPLHLQPSVSLELDSLEKVTAVTKSCTSHTCIIQTPISSTTLHSDDRVVLDKESNSSLSDDVDVNCSSPPSKRLRTSDYN